MITAATNPKLKLVRKLLAQKRKRDELGLFAVEGEDLVAAAAAAGSSRSSCSSAGETVEPALLAAVSTLPHPARVDRASTGRPTSRASRARRRSRSGMSPIPATWARSCATADAFGAAVALSDGCADPLGPKALRASAGAIFRVPLLPFDEAPGTRIALVAHGGTPLHELDLAGETTFVLGAEREGLPEELVAVSN